MFAVHGDLASRGLQNLGGLRPRVKLWALKWLSGLYVLYHLLMIYKETLAGESFADVDSVSKVLKCLLHSKSFYSIKLE